MKLQSIIKCPTRLKVDHMPRPVTNSNLEAKDNGDRRTSNQIGTGSGTGKGVSDMRSFTLL
jgi:hypothetical protein